MSNTVADLLGPAKKRSGKNLAASLAEPTPDPLADIEYTGDLETDCTTELDALLEAFKGRRRKQDQRFNDVTDSEYWFAVCFTSREEKEAFLKVSKLMQLGDKYLDGAKVATILGLEG